LGKGFHHFHKRKEYNGIGGLFGRRLKIKEGLKGREGFLKKVYI